MYPVTFITGSMFTGKTTWLLEHKNKYYKNNSIMYRPNLDTRTLKTHKGIPYTAKSVGSIADLGEAFSDIIKAVYFDEIQFFENSLGLDLFIEQINLIKTVKPIYMAGLNFNFKIEPFLISKYFEHNADDIKKLKTYCAVCGKLSDTYSFRKSNETDNIVIGGSDIYEPRCLKCMECK